MTINVKKTKEIVIDFRRTGVHEPVYINDNEIEQVNEYKYLGTVIDDKLNWNKNTQVVFGKVMQRMFFLRKLKQFNVDKTILHLFYQSVIQSIVTFNIVSVYGSLSQKNRERFERVRKMAQRSIGLTLPSFDNIFSERAISKVHRLYPILHIPCLITLFLIDPVLDFVFLVQTLLDTGNPLSPTPFIYLTL